MILFLLIAIGVLMVLNAIVMCTNIGLSDDIDRAKFFINIGNTDVDGLREKFYKILREGKYGSIDS